MKVITVGAGLAGPKRAGVSVESGVEAAVFETLDLLARKVMCDE
jgi:predicted flavoprotein YhiN